MNPSKKFWLELDLTSPKYAGLDDNIFAWCVLRALMDMIHTKKGLECFPQVYHVIIWNIPTDYLSWSNIWGLNYPDRVRTLFNHFYAHYSDMDDTFQTLFLIHLKASFYVKTLPKISHAA